MNDHDIGNDLKRLGRETLPSTSMVEEVMRRIGQVPQPGMPLKRSASFTIYRIAAVLLATAACIAFVLFIFHPALKPKANPIVIVPQTQSVDHLTDAIPRLIDYQRAFKQSPEALEALLQRQPAEFNSKDERAIRVTDQFRSDLNLY